MSVAADLWSDLLEGEEVAYVGGESARPPRFAPIPEGLHPKVADALAARGIEQLFTHQADAWDAAQRGEHLVVATGTASGKTLAFNLPVLDALARQPKTRALYLYPTKALAQDQMRSLTELKPPAIKPAIYDGDTESSRRWQIRKWSNLILTNPDMLHVGVLPHHDRWGDVLHNLRYVVVDEAHVYRGVFGSHVGNVLRRLRRLARIYGADPQFLLASATIANPGELARRLLGVEATTIEQDGAPKAERTILLWNPPLTDEELGLRASALGEAARLMASLVERGVRTLCFAKSRKSAELVHRFTAQRLGDATRLSPYRAGYTPAQRREIERRLVEGDLLGVSATNALELGIDVGLLDAVVCVGFPGTVASLRQQWGRAGRRGHGLAAMVATEDALDQFFMRDPESLLDRRVEAAILDHANPRVLDGHVRSAAFEAPLDEKDAETLGPEALDRAAQLPDLRRKDGGFVWAGRDYPAGRFGLRSATPDSFTVVDVSTGSLLGLVEQERAYSTVHQGAVYLHLGESYRVAELDLENRTALVEPYTGDEYTQAKKDTMTAIVEPLREERRLGLDLTFGRVVVTEQVVAYQRKRIGDGETIETLPLDLPETRVRDRSDLVRPRRRDARGADGHHASARLPPRRRARDDRDPPSLGDVRPLGHRRALDEPPLPDRPADDLRLRRPRRRGRDQRARLRRLRGLGRRHGALARGLPLRPRLPVLRPVAQVREPERAARQGRLARTAPTDAVDLALDRSSFLCKRRKEEAVRRLRRNIIERETAKRRAITDELRHHDPFGKPDLLLVHETMLARLRAA